MEIKTDDAWVIVSGADRWSSPYLVGDCFYTDKKEADAMCEKMNSHHIRPTTNPAYYVDTLYEWMQQCVRNGENIESERNREY